MNNFFNRDKIKVVYQKFEHPVYSQTGKEFIPNMSAVDLLFNHGPESKHILASGGDWFHE
tara:strand:- start:26 stop:205 length:180 start_codon:yes stop_codon:yes gene_type:complete